MLGIGAAQGIQRVRGSTLPPAELVIARVDGDAKQPAAQTSRRTVERLQAAISAQERLLSRIRCILGIAKGAVADVEHLALERFDQRVEGAKLAAPGCSQRNVECARIGLHSTQCYSLAAYATVTTMKLLRWLPSVLFLAPWLLSAPLPSESARLRDLVGPASFRLLDWETLHLGERLGRVWTQLCCPPSDSTSTDAATLTRYFQARTERDQLRAGAEVAMERLVGQAYVDGGVARSEPLPLAGIFPPVLVALTLPPNVLVIAPRTELRVVHSSVMQAMDVAAQEQLETSADSTGVSSLVAPIGGIATYPSMVLEDDSAERVLASVAHEWMHQYLIFYPLGAGYWDSQETREINETGAEMIGAEVGGQLARSLGLSVNQSGGTAPTSKEPAFDFRAYMRETRVQVEQLLGSGEVDAAEAYMRQRRDELAAHGYAVRKLNQAYFALYGSYGEGFAASPGNPIPGLLHRLRDSSPSLGDFVVCVRGITSVAELRQAAG